MHPSCSRPYDHGRAGETHYHGARVDIADPLSTVRVFTDSGQAEAIVDELLAKDTELFGGER